MRLFVGFGVGAAVGAAATVLMRDLQARVAQMAPQARLTWVPPERLHVTVRFIGHVDAARASAIHDRLAPRLDARAFDAVVQGVGTFPDRRPPRVVWAGLSSGSREVVALAREVSARLAPLVPEEDEDLQPHLTLARVKEPHGLRAPSLLEGLAAVRLGVIRVEAVTLYETRPSKNGVQYLPLLRTTLVGGDSSENGERRAER